MCSLSNLLLVLLVSVIGATQGFTITSKTRPDEFPLTIPNENNPNTFFKIGNNTEPQEISCPEGYIFSARKLHCERNQNSKASKEHCVHRELDDGDWPNPDNCFTFFSCTAQCCTIMPCGSYLLFDPSQDRCDYPSVAQCCEYPEKNSNQLVQTV